MELIFFRHLSGKQMLQIIQTGKMCEQHTSLVEDSPFTSQLGKYSRRCDTDAKAKFANIVGGLVTLNNPSLMRMSSYGCFYIKLNSI